MTNQRISWVTFIISVPLSLAGYLVSDEPIYFEVCFIIVLVCWFLSFVPNMTYTPYERPEMQPPINPDNESEPDWLQEIKTLNYEIKPSKHWTYAQQLEFDPCPQQ